MRAILEDSADGRRGSRISRRVAARRQGAARVEGARDKRLARRPRFPCCVKSRASQGSAELFSQLPSPGRGYQWNWFSICMKLRQMFYTQIERRTFHTAWKSGDPMAFAERHLRSQL